MTKLLRYLKDYRKESILSPLFKLLEASFELFVPLVMAKIIDVGIPNQDVSYIVKMCLLMVLLGVVGLVCSLTAQYYAAKAAVGFAASVRRDLFGHIQRFSYSELDTIGTSTLMTRMTSDINQVQNGVNMFLRLFMRSPFIVFGAMVMAFTIDVQSASVFAVTIPVLLIVVFAVLLISIPLYKKVQSRLDRVLMMTRENLVGARVIRAFNKEEDEISQYENAGNELKGVQLFVGRISALLNPVTYVMINVAIVALIWVGGIRVNLGSISQGDVVALINYMSQILIELVKLANLIITLTKAIACGNRIQGIFDTKSGMAEGSREPVQVQRTNKVVEFDHVGFAYQGAQEESLSGIHFTALRGQTIGIIGGTGAGKSSLVNLIARFYDATSGRVLVDGVDVKDYPFHQLRGKIGMVPQKAVLFQGTIAENLRWGKRDATEAEMYRALETAQARDFVEAKEKGLQTEVQQGGKNFSGGQKQRLTIARAVIRNPEILILDDSASALDYATDARLRKAIRRMDPDITVFLVSQRAATIQYADQIIVLDDGEMAGLGTHQELLEHCEVYQEIYYSQFPKEA
ncbi:ABC transporter ATP-binding protein [Massiliimalia massiliensis]|uniref:ABC transporter ATP-binding protein n=1 Tax=Massiliimalia massiliensis TaxID=1852384 RepID=UPI000985C39C|nr:ABC transporter ATP-binding protein [Massiliimalia massiliensis]